jgi:hypothetical protein
LYRGRSARNVSVNWLYHGSAITHHEGDAVAILDSKSSYLGWRHRDTDSERGAILITVYWRGRVILDLLSGGRVVSREGAGTLFGRFDFAA